MECGGVGSGIDKTVLSGKLVVETVQFGLFCGDEVFREILCLISNQLTDTFPDGDQTFDTTLCCSRYIYRIHAAVFPVIDFALYNGIAEVSHIGQCGNRQIFLAVQHIVQVILGDFCMDVLDGIGQQIFNGLPLIG